MPAPITITLLPSANSLPIDRLTAVFADTTNAYKFYWLKAILLCIKAGYSGLLPKQVLLEKMFEQVWYPLDYYKLSFGRQDSFRKVAGQLHQWVDIDHSAGAPSILVQLEQNLKGTQRQWWAAQMEQFYRYVPYRFIRPFFQQETAGLKDAQVDGVLKSLAKDAAVHAPHLCPYHFEPKGIVLHAAWEAYLREHFALLEGFANWHLVVFLQRNNPNTAGISEKLQKPEVRNLGKVRAAWAAFCQAQPQASCIYSEQSLSGNFSLDHYVPWSYVVHDLNWNLAPVPTAVNSSKSDRLPDDRYLDRLIEQQFAFFHDTKERGGFHKVLEDYCLLFQGSLPEISSLSPEAFAGHFRETINPMLQIARNAGFQSGWIYTT